MNWEHFKTFVWLRWRLAINQFRKAGMLNLILVMSMLSFAAAGSVVLFIVALVAGSFALPQAPPIAVLLVWDGVVVIFLFSWLVGLLTELQRSELLSMDKFLHLPVSASNVFVLNYLGSLVSVTLVLFVPGSVGLCLALIIAKGPALVVVLPLLLSFLLLVTALTYQFQSWLGSVVANPRKRRTVIVFATMFLILVSQAPQLFNLLRFRDKTPGADEAFTEEIAELNKALAEKRIDPAEHSRRRQQAQRKQQERRSQADRQGWRSAREWAELLNVVLPIGWLPYGAMAATEGNVLPALGATAVMGLAGAWSLRRSYRTTLRLYTGHATGKPRRAAPVAPKDPTARPAPASRTTLIERRLPWLSERASAVTLATFQSLLRAPESKMMLLTPVIMTAIFGTMLLTNPYEPVEQARPLLAVGAMAMVLMSLGQMMTNQFGLDRSGFRGFVLSPAPRGDVLLGKNLAFAPFIFALAGLMVVALQLVCPMRWDHLLAAPAQLVSMYLPFCLLANLLSILAPMPIAPGTMRPTNMKATVFLMHLLFLFFFPLALVPTLLPIGIESLLWWLGVAPWAPVNLVLSLLLTAAVVAIYRAAIRAEGRFLAAREQKILDTVTAKVQ